MIADRRRGGGAVVLLQGLRGQREVLVVKRQVCGLVGREVLVRMDGEPQARPPAQQGLLLQRDDALTTPLLTHLAGHLPLALI